MKRYALIGDPVDRSPSPAFQQAAFDALGIEATYEARRVTTLEPELWRDLSGFNVTVPHKLAIGKFLDGTDEIATAIGAINTVKRVDDRWVVTNTHAHGFLDAVHPETNLHDAVVLGAGGASRAVVWALAARGVTATVIDRQGLQQKPPPTGVLVSTVPPTAFDDVRPWLEDCGAHTFIDVTYGRHGKTPLTEWARARGAQTWDGTDMLLHQGARSFAFWTGRAMPMPAARAALLEFRDRDP